MKPNDKVNLNRIKTLNKLYGLLWTTTAYSYKDCRIIASMIYYSTAYRNYNELKDECLAFLARLECPKYGVYKLEENS